MLMRLIPAFCISVHGTAPCIVPTTRFTGFGATAFTIALHRIHVGRIGRIQHVGADLGERHETFDRVVEIGTALKIVVRASREDDTALRHFRGRAHARDGVVEVADRLCRITARVFDANARKARGNRGFDGGGNVGWCLTVAVLEVAVDRQIGQPANQPRVLDVLIARYRVPAVEPSQR